MAEVYLRLEHTGLTFPRRSAGVITPAEFMRRLPQTDRPAVREMVRALHGVKKLYQQHNNSEPAEFAAYGWGGVVTKGEMTRDVDVALVTTDTKFAGPYVPSPKLPSLIRGELRELSGGDPVLGRLVEPLMRDYYWADHQSESYSEHLGAEGKDVFRLEPVIEEEGRRAIDVTYIRGVPSTTVFEEKIDVDERGDSLPKVRLARVQTAGRREHILRRF